MRNIEDLNKLVTRAIGLVYLVPAVFIPIVALLAWSQYQTHQTIENLTRNIPVMVVPGAIAGVYTAGINEENLLNACRHVTGLITVFTRTNAKERLDEMEAMVDNTYLVTFKAMKTSLLREVEERSQGRSFSEVKGSAALITQKDGSYKCHIRGERTFFSGSLVLDQNVGEVELHFKLSSPSEKNKYGIAILGVDVRTVK